MKLHIAKYKISKNLCSEFRAASALCNIEVMKTMEEIKQEITRLLQEHWRFGA